MGGETLMDLSVFLPVVVGALVQEVRHSGPEASPLADADPMGRADVLVSRMVERVANGYGPGVGIAYQQLKPAVDTLLENTFKGTRFGKQPTKKVRNPNARKPKIKTGVLKAEFV